LCTFPLTLTVQVNSNPPWAVRSPRPLSEQIPVCINRQQALRNFQRPFAPISFLCLLKKSKALGTIRRCLNTTLGCRPPRVQKSDVSEAIKNSSFKASVPRLNSETTNYHTVIPKDREHVETNVHMGSSTFMQRATLDASKILKPCPLFVFQHCVAIRVLMKLKTTHSLEKIYKLSISMCLERTFAGICSNLPA